VNPLLIPAAAVQGVRLRRRLERLPEAAGPTSGTAGGGDRTPVRLAVIGESTAAGCGAPTHEDAFAGALARSLAERCARPIAWTVHGCNGATSRDVRYRLLPRLAGPVDVAVLMIGVNDVKGLRPLRRWHDDLSAILDALTHRSGEVAVTGIPPFDVFPSMPRALGRLLAGRAHTLDTVARRLCADRPGARWVGSRGLIPVEPESFARDGFHPSPRGYRLWAQAVSDRLTSGPPPVPRRAA
jgi:lysophospholipase L1-like esterase